MNEKWRGSFIRFQYQIWKTHTQGCDRLDRHGCLSLGFHPGWPRTFQAFNTTPTIAARIRPASDGGGGAEDGAARVAGGAGRALRHPPAPRIPGGVMKNRSSTISLWHKERRTILWLEGIRKGVIGAVGPLHRDRLTRVFHSDQPHVAITRFQSGRFHRNCR